MDAIINLVENFINLDEDKLLRDIYRQIPVQRFIIKLNTEEQLREGLSAKGERIGTYRSIPYSIFKQEITGRKAAFGLVDLYVSGRFYATFKVFPEKDGFTIEADTDIYGEDFEEIYKKELIGLTNDSEAILSNFLADFIVEAIVDSIMG